jgi:hypothetical protein
VHGDGRETGEHVEGPACGQRSLGPMPESTGRRCPSERVRRNGLPVYRTSIACLPRSVKDLEACHADTALLIWVEPRIARRNTAD